MKKLFDHFISSCTQNNYHSQVMHVFVDDCAYEMEPCWFVSFLVLMGIQFGEDNFSKKEPSQTVQIHSGDGLG